MPVGVEHVQLKGGAQLAVRQNVGNLKGGGLQRMHAAQVHDPLAVDEDEQVVGGGKLEAHGELGVGEDGVRLQCEVAVVGSRGAVGAGRVAQQLPVLHRRVQRYLRFCFVCSLAALHCSEMHCSVS